MSVQANKKGFTIIEVVLVLAIAALIFLMIFVALPALQRGQRDTARKNEAGAITAAITTYRSNNSGTLPAEGAFPSGYLDDLNQITSVEVSNTYTAPGEDEAIVVTSAKCGGANVVDLNGTPKQAAVVVFVEAGDTYCKTV